MAEAELVQQSGAEGMRVDRRQGFVAAELAARTKRWQVPIPARRLLLVHRIPGKDRIIVPEFLVDSTHHVIRSIERSRQDIAVVVGSQNTGVAIVGQRIE